MEGNFGGHSFKTSKKSFCVVLGRLKILPSMHWSKITKHGTKFRY